MRRRAFLAYLGYGLAAGIFLGMIFLPLVLGVLSEPPPLDCPPAAGENYDYGWQPC